MTFNDSDYFKLKRLLESQGLGGSTAMLVSQGGPQYEDFRIVEGQGDEKENGNMEG